MEGFIVDGEIASIESFPYSALLGISSEENPANRYVCGSSIINQFFLLTAAHCVVECSNTELISVVIGHEFKFKGLTSSVRKFKTHEDYNDTVLDADIALVFLQTPMTFDSKIQRVILMKEPPYQGEAFVAGYGLVNETIKTRSKRLRFSQQQVWPKNKCRELFKRLPKGALCAGSIKGYPAGGDSGSALIMKTNHLDFNVAIQIGIVSYKNPDTPSIVVYTNVSYYLDWINQTTKNMHCG